MEQVQTLTSLLIDASLAVSLEHPDPLHGRVAVDGCVLA